MNGIALTDVAQSYGNTGDYKVFMFNFSNNFFVNLIYDMCPLDLRLYHGSDLETYLLMRW